MITKVKVQNKRNTSNMTKSAKSKTQTPINLTIMTIKSVNKIRTKYEHVTPHVDNISYNISKLTTARELAIMADRIGGYVNRTGKCYIENCFPFNGDAPWIKNAHYTLGKQLSAPQFHTIDMFLRRRFYYEKWTAIHRAHMVSAELTNLSFGKKEWSIYQKLTTICIAAYKTFGDDFIRYSYDAYYHPQLNIVDRNVALGCRTVFLFEHIIITSVNVENEKKKKFAEKVTEAIKEGEKLRKENKRRKQKAKEEEVKRKKRKREEETESWCAVQRNTEENRKRRRLRFEQKQKEAEEFKKKEAEELKKKEAEELKKKAPEPATSRPLNRTQREIKEEISSVEKEWRALKQMRENNNRLSYDKKRKKWISPSK